MRSSRFSSLLACASTSWRHAGLGDRLGEFCDFRAAARRLRPARSGWSSFARAARIRAGGRRCVLGLLVDFAATGAALRCAAPEGRALCRALLQVQRFQHFLLLRAAASPSARDEIGQRRSRVHVLRRRWPVRPGACGRSSMISAASSFKLNHARLDIRRLVFGFSQPLHARCMEGIAVEKFDRCESVARPGTQGSCHRPAR